MWTEWTALQSNIVTGIIIIIIILLLISNFAHIWCPSCWPITEGTVKLSHSYNIKLTFTSDVNNSSGTCSITVGEIHLQLDL